jgi:hypothetical protein
MTFLAVQAQNRAGNSAHAVETSVAVARRLAAFRGDFGLRLGTDLPALLHQERRAGDVTGTDWAELFVTARPVRRLADNWQTKPDPDGMGLREKWFASGARDSQKWSRTALGELTSETPEPDAEGTDRRQCPIQPSMPRRGPTWYARVLADEEWAEGIEAFLNFHGVAGAVDVYLNGQVMGGNRATPDAPHAVSFRVRLDPGVRKGRMTQLLIVRLHPPESGPAWPLPAPWLSVPGTAETATGQ